MTAFASLTEGAPDRSVTVSAIRPRDGLHLAAGDAGLLGTPGDETPLVGRAFKDAAIVGSDAQAAQSVERHARACVLQGRVEFDALDAIVFVAALLGVALERLSLPEAVSADYHAVGSCHAATAGPAAGSANA